MRQPARPDRATLLAAASKTIPDVIAHGLRILFCGINPGLYSAAIGHHFGRPGNRFWPALYHAQLTARLLSPYDDRELLKSKYGITNLVSRATATADELTDDEFHKGAQQLLKKVNRYRPNIIALLGIGAYRVAFEQPKANLGRQPQRLGKATVWVLPNPSGLNAHYQIADLARHFRELKEAAEVLPDL